MKRYVPLLSLVLLPLLAGCFGTGTRPDSNEKPLTTTSTTAASAPGATVRPLIDGETAEQIYSDAVNLVYEGYYAEAMTKLKYLVDKQVIDRYVYETLLELYVNKLEQLKMQGDARKLAAAVKEARKVSEDALAYYPSDLHLLQIHTDIVRTDGDTRAFVSSLSNILALYPNDTFGNYYFGAYYYLGNVMNKAYPYLQNVIRSTTPSTEFDVSAIYSSYYYCGMIDIQRGNYASAITNFESAKTFVNNDTDLSKALGVIYSQLLYFRKAEENFAAIPSNMLTQQIAEPYIGVMLVDGSTNTLSVANDFFYESVFAKAVVLYLKGDYTNALIEAGRVPRGGYSSYYVHYLRYLIDTRTTNNDDLMKESFILGKLAKDIGNYPVAIRFFKNVENYTNAAPDIYWLIGSLYDDLSDATNAIRYYEKYLSYGQQLDYMAMARIRLAYMYYTAGRMQDSLTQVALAKRSAKTQQELTSVYFYSGLMNFELKKYDAAITDFNVALTNQPDYYAIYYYIASAYAQLQQYDPAIKTLNIARAKVPDSPEMNNLLAYLYALKVTDLDEALKLINLALLEDPQNIAYLDTLGWVYFQRREYDKAFEVYMSLERKVQSENYAMGLDEVYYHIGMIYEQKGDKDEAVRYYRMGIASNPDNALIRTRMQSLGVQ